MKKRINHHLLKGKAVDYHRSCTKNCCYSSLLPSALSKALPYGAQFL